MYKKGEILMCKVGRYKSCKVIITGWEESHTPTLYLADLLVDNTKLAYFENELETVFQHDKNRGLFDPIPRG